MMNFKKQSIGDEIKKNKTIIEATLKKIKDKEKAKEKEKLIRQLNKSAIDGCKELDSDSCFMLVKFNYNVKGIFTDIVVIPIEGNEFMLEAIGKIINITIPNVRELKDYTLLKATLNGSYDRAVVKLEGLKY